MHAGRILPFIACPRTLNALRAIDEVAPAGAIEKIRPGDIVWFEPGERHWHRASPTTPMTHIAIAEMLDGKAVEWMELVTDEQYGG